MAKNEIDLLEEHEWMGFFWFPEKEDEKFSGKLSYAPNKGLQLSLISNDLNGPGVGLLKDNARKLMHGVVDSGDKQTAITLFNVYLNSGFSMGSAGYIKSHKGFVWIAVFGHMFEDDTFNSIEVSYDKNFENLFFFFGFRDRAILKLSEQSDMQLEGNTKISLNYQSSGTSIYGMDDIDSVFWSTNDEKYMAMKQALEPFLNDKDFHLFKRNDLRPKFVFDFSDGSLQSILHDEYKWREFWGLVADECFSVKSAWIRVPDEHEGKTYFRSCAMLGRFNFDARTRRKRSFHDYSIKLSSFGEGTNGLSDISDTYAEWLKICNDANWREVTNKIKDLIQNDSSVTTREFSSLISASKCLLTLLDKPAYISTLFEFYLSEEHKDTLENIFQHIPYKEKESNRTIGRKIDYMRNAIEHPHGGRSEEEDRISELCWQHLIKNSIALEKVYAYVAGAFLKAVLLKLGNINQDNVDEFITSFVELRASLEEVVYR